MEYKNHDYNNTNKSISFYDRFVYNIVSFNLFEKMGEKVLRGGSGSRGRKILFTC